MEKKYFKKIQLLFILLVTSIGFSQTDITVSDDAYVRGGENDGTVYNGGVVEVKESSSGNVAFSRHAFLKFDISTYSSITSAVLHISGNQASGSAFDITVSEVLIDTWAESALTWSNSPAITNAIGTFSTPGDIDDVYQDFQIDVTSYIQSQLTGDKIASMSLTDASSTNDTFRFMSKENTVGGTPAYLTIVGSILGVQDQIKSKFEMYPNPTQSSFVIQASNSEIASVGIYSINGGMLFNNNSVNSNELKIDVSSFQTGVYFVKVVNAQGGLSVEKLIKK